MNKLLLVMLRRAAQLWRLARMTSPSVHNPNFTLRGLAFAVAISAAVVSVLEIYWRWQSGKWEATSLAIIPVVAWFDAVIAFRWRQIMKEQADGTFSVERYRADPQAYIWGSSRLRRFAIIVAVVFGVVYAFAIAAVK